MLVADCEALAWQNLQTTNTMKTIEEIGSHAEAIEGMDRLFHHGYQNFSSHWPWSLIPSNRKVETALTRLMPVCSLCLMSRRDSMIDHRILKNNLDN